MDEAGKSVYICIKYLRLKTKDYILGGCTVTHRRFLLTASLLRIGSGVENEESLIKQTDP